MMKLSRGVVGLAMGLMAAGVVGQPPNKGKPGPDSKGAPKIITRVDPHDWTFTGSVNLRVYEEKDIKTNMPKKEAFDFTSAAIVYPLVGETASSVMVGKESDVTGKMRLNDRVIAEKPNEILVDYPAGTKLAKWSMMGWKGEEVAVELKYSITSWQTKFDEALANKCKWAENYPGAAATALEPEYWIDMGMDGPYDMAPVKDLVKKWMGGKDPKTISPVQAAKFLAGQVMQHVQTSGNGIATNKVGEMSGIALQGAPVTAKLGKGSEFDMVQLLVAVYRQIGLPARSVIGWDAGDSKDGKFLGKGGSASMRAWVEFALVDPNQPDPVWVPVDVVRMRKSSTRPPALDRPWPFFGDNKELDGVIPFAFQFFPPSKGVISYGSPAFFGWMVTPKPPEHVVQTLKFGAISTPKRAEDMKKDEERKKDEKKKKSPYGG